MHAAVHELRRQDDHFESQLEDGKPIEVCFSGIWYPATVVRTKGYKLYYRLDEGAQRIVHKIILFWKRSAVFTYPVGHHGEITIRYGENVRLRAA